MKIHYNKHFKNSLFEFPESIQKKFYKQVNYLLYDLRHPSLHAKKYDEGRDIWQARIDQNVRLYFLIEKDIYVLLEIKYHPK